MFKTALLKRITSVSVVLTMALSIVTPLSIFAADDLPNTYESLGVDAAAKEAFEQNISSQTNLPVINVTTNNNSEMILSREVYTECVVDVFNAGEDYELNETSADIKVRGNSSAYYGDVEQIKKNLVPYRIKFDKKQGMLGLNDGAKCKSWVLLKPEWNMIPNEMAFRLGRALFGDKAFVSDARFVLLYVNDKLQGVYLLCEQSQVNKYRVDVTEPEKDYTGTDIGYYVELDNYAGQDPDEYYFHMDYEKATVTDVRGETRKFVSADYTIKNDVYSQDQVDFISKYLNNLFKIIYQAIEKNVYLTFDENYDLVESNYQNPKQAISAVMDLESVVDMYLLYEMVHDYDCGEGSFYMCVDFAEGSKTPKLQFTSPWDFNWAYDGSTSRYWAGAFCDKDFARRNGDRSNPWFIMLAKEQWFRDLCGKKWAEYGDTVKAAVQEERDMLNADYNDYVKYTNGGIYCVDNVLDFVSARINWIDNTFKKPSGNIDYDEYPDLVDAELKYQLMEMDDDFYGLRLVLVANEDEIKDIDYALAYITAQSQPGTNTLVVTRAYRSIMASGQTVYPGDGKVFLLAKFIGIPSDMIEEITGYFEFGDHTLTRAIRK